MKDVIIDQRFLSSSVIKRMSAEDFDQLWPHRAHHPQPHFLSSAVEQDGATAVFFLQSQ